tara:strand:- start:90 stop:428 length:339 start_codon:yes stop_codon:yes gene_type:complete
MANYTGKLKEIVELYVGREVNFLTEVRMEDVKDGSGPKIIYWDASSLGKSQPTTSQLDALVSNADTVVANNKVRDTRRTAYGDIGEQLDEIYKDVDAWRTRIKKIKDDNPKS